MKRKLWTALLLTTIFLPFVTKNHVGCSPPPEVQAAVATRGISQVQTAVAEITVAPEGMATTEVSPAKTAVASW